MSKVSDIREICGDYAIDIEYSKDFTFTMFFNSRRNAETVKRCVEVDDRIPNVATAVDFVEVVRCKDCKHCRPSVLYIGQCYCENSLSPWYNDHFDVAMSITDYCSYGERRENGKT